MTKKPEPSSTPQLKTHIILLRGLAREARHWGEFPKQLEVSAATQLGATRVDCLDFPGAGVFSEMSSPTSIGEITEFVRGKFWEIRAKQRERGETNAEKTHLVAISLGGMVANDWLERWAEDFATCTLINTSFRGFSPFLRRLTPHAVHQLATIAAKRLDAEERERQILNLVSNRPDVIEKTVKEWAQIHLTRPVSIPNFLKQLTAAARYRPNRRNPGVPILVLNSANDRMVHPSCSESIAERWHADLRIHPTAGHDLSLDEPEWTADQIVGWLKNQRD